MLIKSLSLVILATFAFSGETEAPKKPSFAEEAYNKSIEANSKDVYKTYDVYLKALEVANQKIVKDLEKIKVDLNDTKKFTKLTISDRASAITEIDGKIAEIRKGALGEKVVGSSLSSGDLLGEENTNQKNYQIGLWNISTGTGQNGKFTFTKDGKWASPWGDFCGEWGFDNDKLWMKSICNSPITIKMIKNIYTIECPKRTFSATIEKDK